MISMFGRLYNIDDQLMTSDQNSTDCFIIYEINGTQPFLSKPVFVDPNKTRALIDSAKAAGNRKKMWANLSGVDYYKWLAIIAIVGSLAYAFLTGGGF